MIAYAAVEESEKLVVISADFKTVEDARCALPAVLNEAEQRQLDLDFDDAELPKQSRRKFTVPRDYDTCRSIAALFVNLVTPGEKTVEECAYRYNVKQIQRALKHLQAAGIVETRRGKKRTYYTLSDAARAELVEE